MRIAVVSDTHFGDDLCPLVSPGPDGGPAEPGPHGHYFDAYWRSIPIRSTGPG